MFSKSFYPTPRELANKMISTLDLNIVGSILEPSAGKGDLIDVVNENMKRYHDIDIDCIEINSELACILKNKNYRVIYDDFLAFSTMKQYDLILMNPPFSNGAEHLLKAISMQERFGGSIVCILNAETIKNPYSNIRKELNQKLDLYEADIEFIQDSFKEAERVTNVEIALIKIIVKRKEKLDSLIIENLMKAEMRNEIEYEDNKYPINDDFIKEIINQYQLESLAGIKLIEEFNSIKPYIISSFDDKYDSTILELKINSQDASINEYLRKVRLKYWRALFSNDKFTGSLTRNLLSNYWNKVDKLKDYDFNMYNICQIKIDMNKNIVRGIEETIVNLFDELGRKYSYYEGSSNVHYYNGWKTNKSYIVNKKVIIRLDAYSYYDKKFRPTNYDVYSELKDIEKSLAFLDTKNTLHVDLKYALSHAEHIGKNTNIELKYFNVTFYKKGTCHITFKDEELLKKFNIFGSQRKRWLPPSYCKKKFNEMSIEEQEVIREFEGEQSYNKTFSNMEYYIVKENDFLIE